MKRRTPIAVLGGLIAAAGLIAAPLSPAEAQPGSVVHQTAAKASERQQIRDYWTADRMRNAKKRTVKPGKGWQPSEVAKGSPTVFPGQGHQKGANRGTAEKSNNGDKDGNGNGRDKTQASEGSSYLGGPWNGGGRVVATTGKVFFTLSGSDYVCSASVVPASNSSTVSTAGHCLNEGPGDYVTRFLFVPAYDNGSAPYGEWPASAVATTSEWRYNGDFNYDVGFAVIAPQNGRHISDVVGAQTIGFNQPRREFLYAFGYPAASPYDGTELTYCSDTATDDVNGTEDQRLDCNMTGGSSGGPWFDDFTESDGTGVQVSVNSFGYVGEENAMYGPYFGSTVQDLYYAVESYS